jgi:hypothetical protein
MAISVFTIPIGSSGSARSGRKVRHLYGQAYGNCRKRATGSKASPLTAEGAITKPSASCWARTDPDVPVPPEAIIRRYITDKPKSECGQELKALMKALGSVECSAFISAFFHLQEKYRSFREERNERKEFKHQKLRQAFKSIQDNLHALFTYQDMPDLNIPPTINHLEGLFSHLKERIKIHRGLKINRKKKTVKAFLTSFNSSTIL